MTMEQEREWAEAQKITVSIDLVEAAKNHLKFLAAVDRNRFLYEDHVLQRAMYRYNAFWLPMLAKHLESPTSEAGPLVIPLDCEWIWHCHRLNPVRYKFDCEKMYGRILTNRNIISSVQATSTSKTEEIWKKMYPEEPFELDLNRSFSDDVLQNRPYAKKFTKYDLLSAVKRQISFTSQVSRPHVSDDLFLQEAMARYKGFLHLIRSNVKSGLKLNVVPTYDVDLMWHTHQLHPDSYSKDTNELVGFVLQHDDMDSDKSKGGKLHNGYTETTKQWEQTFGRSYWKAGAHRVNSPTPVTQAPFAFNVEDGQFYASSKIGNRIQFTTAKAVEVLLEFADIKNLPEEYKENLVVYFSKNQPDILFNSKASLGISSNSKEKQVASFRCEPKGEFLFELVSSSQKLLGSCSLSLKELLAERSQLSTNKWVSVNLASDLGNANTVLLHVSLSFTPPTEAPQVFQLVRSQSVGNDMIQTLVVNAYGKKVFTLQKRNIVKQGIKCNNDLLEVYSINDVGEKHGLVEFDGDCWSVKGTHGSFKLQKCDGKDGSIFELVGYKTVKLFPGRKLEFEVEHLKNEISDQDFWTAVEFNTEYPYGRAIALIDSKSGNIKAIDDWIFVPSIALTFMISDLTKECGHINCVHKIKSADASTCVTTCHPVGGCSVKSTAEDMVTSVDGSGCGCFNPGHSGGCAWKSATEDMLNSVDGSGCGCFNPGHPAGCAWKSAAGDMVKSVDGSGCGCFNPGHPVGCAWNSAAGDMLKSVNGSGCGCFNPGHPDGCAWKSVARDMVKSVDGSGCGCFNPGLPAGCAWKSVAENMVKSVDGSGCGCFNPGHPAGCAWKSAVGDIMKSVDGSGCGCFNPGHPAGCAWKSAAGDMVKSVDGSGCGCFNPGHPVGCAWNSAAGDMLKSVNGSGCGCFNPGHPDGCAWKSVARDMVKSVDGSGCGCFNPGHPDGCAWKSVARDMVKSVDGSGCGCFNPGHPVGCAWKIAAGDMIKGADGGGCAWKSVAGDMVKSVDGSGCGCFNPSHSAGCAWKNAAGDMLKTASATCLYECSTGCTPVIVVDVGTSCDMIKTADEGTARIVAITV